LKNKKVDVLFGTQCTSNWWTTINR